MVVREIKKDIYGFIINDWSRRLFDELIPLPQGTTYNAYFIKNKKNVLIDTADPAKTEKLLKGLHEINAGNIDYIISNHSEQDHSGSIPALLKEFPGAKVIASEKAAGLLKSMLLIPDKKIVIVKNGEVLSLGEKNLHFLYAPWVHWPETMITYCPEDKILYSCDLFGSHLATSDFYARCGENLYGSAKRYYAEIMMPFRNNILNHLKFIDELPIEIIAPSHGPVYDNPDFIIGAYKEWSSANVKNEVAVPFVSMHGSVGEMVDFFTDELIKKGVRVKPFNLTGLDIGELAMALLDAATVVLGTPTVLAGPHPSAVYAAYLFKALRPKTKFVSVIGSFGWGGNMLKFITDMLPQKIEILDPVLIKGRPQKPDFALLKNLAGTIIEKHRQLNLK